MSSSALGLRIPMTDSISCRVEQDVKDRLSAWAQLHGVPISAVLAGMIQQAVSNLDSISPVVRRCGPRGPYKKRKN